MKLPALLGLALLLTFAGCKKKNENPEPIEEQITVTDLTDKDFIQYIEVPGSEKIVFDSVLNAYLVSLPSSYVKDEINIKFKFYPGAFLNTGHSARSSEEIDFTYRGRSTLFFQVSTSKEKLADYQVFVKHNGPLKATLYTDEDFHCDPDGNFNVPLIITSGMGTIPSAPGLNEEPQAILKDEKTGTQLLGGVSQSNLYFNNVLPFAQSGNVSVTFKYNNQTVTLAQNKKLSLMKMVVYGISGIPLLSAVPPNQKVEISGNGFTPKPRYRLKFESDFLTTPVTANADFSETLRLSTTIPGSLPSGSYSIGVYQNDTLINRVVHTISSNEKEKSIGQMWTRQLDYPTADRFYLNANRIVLEKGGTVFVNPFPAIYTYGQIFDPAKVLPDLQLKTTTGTVTLKAEAKHDPSYADGTLKVYYGMYTLPGDIAAGFYEARLVYADKSVSLPFWSKIEVK